MFLCTCAWIIHNAHVWICSEFINTLCSSRGRAHFYLISAVWSCLNVLVQSWFKQNQNSTAVNINYFFWTQYQHQSNAQPSQMKMLSFQLKCIDRRALKYSFPFLKLQTTWISRQISKRGGEKPSLSTFHVHIKYHHTFVHELLCVCLFLFQGLFKIKKVFE